MGGEKLRTFQKQRACTLLGINPTSKNSVDAVLEIANENLIPLMLIASRRQVEAADLGHGYVNSWSTEEFAKYVNARNLHGQVILGRDHGGPWQSDIEIRSEMSTAEAMERAKQSFKVDIQSGFQFLHIDPSSSPFQPSTFDEVFERLIELYDYCLSFGKDDLIIEIGTEEQHSGFQNLTDFEALLQKFTSYCDFNSLPRPTFVVAQTGTLVQGTANVGEFPGLISRGESLIASERIHKIINICNRYGLLLKEHNGDYLPDNCLALHSKWGIHSMNIGPQLGVTETLSFLSALEKGELKDLANDFIRLSLSTEKWKKWVGKNTETTDFKKAVMAGHYIFGQTNFIELKKEASYKLAQQGVDLDSVLKQSVKDQILRHVYHLGILTPPKFQEVAQ